MENIKNFFLNLEVNFVDKDNTIVIPNFKDPQIVITATNNGVCDLYTVCNVAHRCVFKNLAAQQATEIAFFLYFIPHMRTMNDELDETIQHGFYWLLRYYVDETRTLHEDRDDLMRFIYDKLIPFTEEVNKK